MHESLQGATFHVEHVIPKSKGGESSLENLASELDKSPTTLAQELRIPANRISQLIAGKRAMTADTSFAT
jgi:plasmid maintenance system antidote protein VapI